MGDKFKIRQDPRWPEAHVNLLGLWDRRPEGMTQEQFGAEYGLGSQGMVWQYLNGYTPLNFEAASKFAKGLRCTIKDISPEMDAVMRSQLLPAMGIASWGKMAIVLLAILPLFPPDAGATSHNNNYAQPASLIWIMRRLIFLLAMLAPRTKTSEGRKWTLRTT